MALDLSNVSVLAEFERSGTAFEYASNEEVKICCPFHDDHSPSCFVNIKKALFVCHTAGCGKSGNILQLFARIGNTLQGVVLADLQTRYDLDGTQKVIEPALIEEYHAKIWNAHPLREELYKRMVTDEDIRHFRLGEDKGRIIIPITSESQNYVNLRKYLPGAPGPEKMRNVKGHGETRFYPSEQLRFDQLLFVGGEVKTYPAIRELNQYGIGCITATCGEDNLTIELARRLTGKTIYMCLDIDEAGIKAAHTRCIQLCRFARWISQPIKLPLDIDKFPKGDISNYYAIGGKMKPLIDSAPQFIPVTRQRYDLDEAAVDLDLINAIHADKTAVRVQIKAVAASVDTAPYIVPKEITIRCNRDQKMCSVCPVFLDNINTFSISAESPQLLEMVNAHKDNQLECVKTALDIPKNCKACDFEATSYYNVEDVRISPQLEITNRATDRVMQPAFCIGNAIELNESYSFTGRMFPHPKTQQSTLLISSYKPTQDALSTYKCDNLQDLSIFWPKDWSLQGIQNKLDSIYNDFSSNITRIYGRQNIHLATDLAYHSPLFIPFEGKEQKGWVETLILGDSANGKSEVVCGSSGSGGLMSHYKLGTKVESKNATIAGILGGCQKSGDRWFVTWGIVPMNDKRLVVFEEVKGMHTDTIGKFTDMRSSGIAEIPKIEKRRTPARTRLIWISNPKYDLAVPQYNFGIEAVKELIGSMEDIRRFDFAIITASSEVNTADLNRLRASRPHVDHMYFGELCRKLVLWAWTRKTDEIQFVEEATHEVLRQASRLCEIYSDAIPLVDRGSMRLKLARLSASLAARLFSCNEDMTGLIVYPEHVEYVANWLESQYSSNTFGYLEFSKAIRLTQQLVDPDLVSQTIKVSPFPNDLMKQLIARARVDLQDIQDFTGYDREKANDLLSLLVRKHALLRDGRYYRKSAPFIVLLKQLIESGGFVDNKVQGKY